MVLSICLISYFISAIYLRKELSTRVNKNLISKENQIYYWCIALMMISSLNYGTIVQYMARILSICLSTHIILSRLISGKHQLKKITISIFFSIYLGICTMSVIYSINKLETLLKSIELWLDFLVIWLLFSSDSYEKVVSNIYEVIFRVLLTLQSIAFIGYTICPSKFSIPATKSILGVQLGGGILGANAIGAVSVLLIIILLNSKRKYNKFLIAFSILVLILAQSRTSLIIAVTVMVVQLLCSKHKIKYLIIVLPIVIIGILNMELLESYFLRGAAESNITGMSGRTYMWKIAELYINDKPLLGYGFGAGGFMVSSLINMSSLHSAYYETLMGVGYIGLIALLGIYIYTGISIIFNIICRGIYYSSNELMFYIFFTIRSYTSLGIANWHSHELLIWIILVFSVSTFKKNSGIVNCINLNIKEVTQND